MPHIPVLNNVAKTNTNYRFAKAIEFNRDFKTLNSFPFNNANSSNNIKITSYLIVYRHVLAISSKCSLYLKLSIKKKTATRTTAVPWTATATAELQ